MGLYLCVFDDDEELDGVEVGSYADFDFFRQTVSRLLESGKDGLRFPTLMMHSDCDGEWSIDECERLNDELSDIAAAFKELPAAPFHSEWQENVAKSIGFKSITLYDSFIDVDGEPLLERLIRLCNVARGNQRPILFQ